MNDLLSRYPELEKCKGSIAEALELLLAVYQNHGKVLVCGNGGSAADSEHIVGELMKGFLLPRQVTDERISMELREKIQGALPAISLCSQEGFLTAFSNDSDPDLVFAQQVYAYGKKEDLVIALKIAKEMGIKTLSLTGENGGLAEGFSTVCIKAPAKETYRIQEYHLPIYHYLCAKTEETFFGK